MHGRVTVSTRCPFYVNDTEAQIKQQDELVYHQEIESVHLPKLFETLDYREHKNATSNKSHGVEIKNQTNLWIKRYSWSKTSMPIPDEWSFVRH